MVTDTTTPAGDATRTRESVDKATQSAHEAIDRMAAKAAPAIEQLQSAATNAAQALREKAAALGEIAHPDGEAFLAVIADDLAKALEAREAALRLAAAGNKPAAVLAYVDYQAARSRLATAATAGLFVVPTQLGRLLLADLMAKARQ